MAGGTALGAAGLFAAAAAGSPLALAAGLVLFGVGSSVVTIGGAGALFRAYPAERRGWALGVRQMAVPLGGMIGAVLVPALEAVGGVSTVLLAAATAVLLSGAAFAVVADSAARGPAAARLPGDPAGARMQRLLVVAAFYIVVLQAVFVYTVPAARDAGLSALAAGRDVLRDPGHGWGGARRLGPGRRSGRRRPPDADARRGRGRCCGRRGALRASPSTRRRGRASRGRGLRVRRPRLERLVYVSAGERAPPELAGPVGRGRGDGGLRSLGPCDSGTRCARARGWDVFWLATAALALAGAAVAATLG